MVIVLIVILIIVPVVDPVAWLGLTSFLLIASTRYHVTRHFITSFFSL